jgi:two-component system sensor histidine kinase ChiS
MRLRHIVSSSILRQLLVILIPMTVLPVFVLGLLLIERGKEATRTAVLRDYREIVKRAAQEIETVIRTPREMLVAMGATVGVASADPWERETAVVELQLNLPDSFKQLAFIDMSGVLRASGSMNYVFEDSLFTRTYTKALEYFRATPRDRFYRSQIYFLADDVPAVTMAVPVRRFGHPVGILAAQLNLREMWDLVDGLRIGENSRAYIVSREGVVIANQDKKPVFRGENWTHLAPVERVLGGEAGSVDYTHPETGAAYLSAYAPLSFGWGIVVEHQAEEAYATVRAMQHGALILITVSIIVTLVIGSYAARSIVHPVLRLVEGTRRISRRDLDHRIELDRRDEIGQLSVAFNEMARSLKASYDGLEQEVERKTADLQRALVEVSRLSELKSQFVSEVSHELRTPLASIQGYAETLIRLRGKISEAQQMDCARTISEESERLARLINNLLDLSRIEAGTIQLERQPLNIVEVAQEAVQTLQPRAAKKTLHLTIHAGAGLPPLLADRDAIRRVLDNLIENAIKYTPSGGAVSVSFEKTDTHARINIADTGIGISEEDRAHIFDRFYRVKTPGTRTSGTGLGLSIVRSLVEEHGGDVTASSVPGQGSVFSFTLPLGAGHKDGIHESEEAYPHRRG